MNYLYGVLEDNKIRLVITNTEMKKENYYLFCSSDVAFHCRLVAIGFCLGKNQIYPVVNDVNEFGGTYTEQRPSINVL